MSEGRTVLIINGSTEISKEVSAAFKADGCQILTVDNVKDHVAQLQVQLERKTPLDTALELRQFVIRASARQFDSYMYDCLHPKVPEGTLPPRNQRGPRQKGRRGRPKS
jgi:NAD(P)-dependent dehydrogenase (short-subunit alcohol dehydrogenase family)